MVSPFSFVGHRRWFLNLFAAFSLLSFAPCSSATLPVDGDEAPRSHLTLTDAWRSMYAPTGTQDPAGLNTPSFDDSTWSEVEVPHNWDTYQGYRQAKHGQLHGTAWYRRTFSVDSTTLAAIAAGQRRAFLLFEGAGSYATVWLNGQEVGRHGGGLTTFTLDITAALLRDASKPNLLVVRTEHPAGIRDLPWVCGGCERAYGFSEGSQPLGLFRPVHVVFTGSVRVAPFGVHVWNDRSVTEQSATAHVRTELTNHGGSTRAIILRSTLLDPEKRVVTRNELRHAIPAGQTITLEGAPLTAAPARLWSLETPTLYTLRTEVLDDSGQLIDRVDTAFGFRWVDWPHGDDRERGTLLLNGKPVFLNGVCEYPHQIGGGYAFTAAQIEARVRQMQAAGFNAFRDAHHPHDLRYNVYWDRDGLAWWTQFGAHIWFDRDDFRANYLALLRDWVKERRNSPSLVMYGLQNESVLPTAFAAQCTELIRDLDPTARDQRLVTTCNGGTGTDWNVPQNWSGTYNVGDPATYADDLRRELLFGEYGGWRSADLPGPKKGAPADPAAGYDEDYFNALLETKVRLADAAKDKSVGHFQWIFSTHDNPGRHFGPRGEHLTDGWSRLDRVGPANNKGLLTSWGEPLDAYYMYRSNFIPAATQPMVIVAGSNRADRLRTGPGERTTIIAYSNCEEVELFNGECSLGARSRGGIGTHFTWEEVEVMPGLLRAVARRGGRVVAEDGYVVPPATTPAAIRKPASDLAGSTTALPAGETAVYRVNCGGPDYVDVHGQLWMADRDFEEGDSWGAISWAHAYPHLPPAFGSIRRSFIPVSGTHDPALYQTFRYGRGELRYRFALPNGDYRVELHFAEPWYGRGNIDATGHRQFDVAINGKTVLREVDLFKEAGFSKALRKSVPVKVADGCVEISFPRVPSYQAILSAIAITTKSADVRVPSAPQPVAEIISGNAHVAAWLNLADRAYAMDFATFTAIPEILRHQPWIRRLRAAVASPLRFRVTRAVDVYVAAASPLADWESTGEQIAVSGSAEPIPLYRKPASAGSTVEVPSAAMVALVPARPLAPAQAITRLTVENATTPASAWRAAGSLARGSRPHGPGGLPITVLPQELPDGDWLVTPPLEPASNLRVRFVAADTIELTVVVDAEASIPDWLRDWVRPNNQRVVIGSRAQNVFRRRFEAGTTVELGANGTLRNGAPAPMYCAFGRLVRPSHTYTSSRPSLVVPEDAVEWTIQTGVGDRYGFTIPLRTSAGAPSKVRYELLDLSGAVLCKDERLTKDLAVDSDGWIRWRLRTCESINAGTYTVRLRLLDGPPISLSSLTVE